MSFNNRNNLPNPSAPWGREVEQRIEGAERNISQTSLESSNGLSSTNNTLAALSNTINALLEQQAMLTEQQNRLIESSKMIITQQGYVGSVPTDVDWYMDQFSATYIPPAWANSARVTFSASNMYGGANVKPIYGNCFAWNGITTPGTPMDSVERFFSVELFPPTGSDGFTLFRPGTLSFGVDVSASRELRVSTYLTAYNSSGSAKNIDLSYMLSVSIDWI